MINLMSAVLFFNGMWHARAQGCSQFAVGATPEAAMVAALTLRDGEMPNADLF
jgi:ABC-type glucose/galactose transport system permease subunit